MRATLAPLLSEPYSHTLLMDADAALFQYGWNWELRFHDCLLRETWNVNKDFWFRVAAWFTKMTCQPFQLI